MLDNEDSRYRVFFVEGKGACLEVKKGQVYSFHEVPYTPVEGGWQRPSPGASGLVFFNHQNVIEDAIALHKATTATSAPG